VGASGEKYRERERSKERENERSRVHLAILSNHSPKSLNFIPSARRVWRTPHARYLRSVPTFRFTYFSTPTQHKHKAPCPPVRLRRHRLFLPTRDMEGITTKTIIIINKNNNNSHPVSLFLYLGTLSASLWLPRSQSVVDRHLPPSIHLPESIILECPSIAIHAPYLPWLMTRLRMVVVFYPLFCVKRANELSLQSSLYLSSLKGMMPPPGMALPPPPPPPGMTLPPVS
jgi:hypothetical protein